MRAKRTPVSMPLVGLLASAGCAVLASATLPACYDDPASSKGGAPNSAASSSESTASSTSSATTTTATTSTTGAGGASCAAHSPKDTLVEPPVLTSEGGKLAVGLVAQPFPGAIALTDCTTLGKDAQPCTYDASSGALAYVGFRAGSSAVVGGLPGPTLVLRQNEALDIQLANNLPGGLSMPIPMLMGPSCPADTTTACSSDAPEPMPDPPVMDPNATNLHTHGLHVSPGTYAEVVAGAQTTADNVYVSVLPGGQHHYDYQTLAPDHPTGLYWYHPHSHMTTNTQVKAGLAGALVIKGSLDDLLESKLPCLEDRVLVLQALLPAIPNMPGKTFDPAWVVNGQDHPTMTIHPGEVQRWRVLNASAGTLLYLALTKDLGACAFAKGPINPAIPVQIDCDLGGAKAPPARVSVIGIDGNPLARPVDDGLPGITLLEDGSFIDHPASGPSTEGCAGSPVKYQQGFLLPPGKRIELLVQFDKATAPGAYSLVTRGISMNGSPNQTTYGRELAKVVVEGAPVTDMEIPKDLLGPEKFGLADLRKAPTDANACLTLAIGGTPDEPDFLINGRNFCPAWPMVCASLGSTAEWNVVNGSVESHPFHIHVNPVQLVRMDGVEISGCGPAVFEDTVALPPAPPLFMPMDDCSDLTTASLSFRTRFEDFTGDPVFHCHLLFHEDGSMMGRFTIAKP